MAKNKGGRPKAIDVNDPLVLKEIQTCGKMAATYEEMASLFDVTVRTIENYMADENGEFFRVYKKEYGEVNKSLRRAQIGAALKGNTSMLIWMGKQRLGQTDKVESKNENTNIDKTVNFIEASDNE